MPIDSELSAFLAQASSMAPPAGIADIRERAEAQAAQMPRRPVPAIRAIDLTMAVEGRMIAARLFRPEKSMPSALTLYLHGGGFIAGSLDTHDHLCREIVAGAGTALLSVAYRLLPEHSIDMAIDDAWAALRWVSEHAAGLGIDRRRLALAGDSAGAHLALATALRARDAGGPTVTAQLLFYPPTDFSGVERPSVEENACVGGLTAEQYRMVRGIVAPDPRTGRDPLVSPLRFADLTGLSPTYISTAEFDVLRDEGVALVAALRQAKVPVDHSAGPGMAHGFANLAGISLSAGAEVDAATAWLAHLLTNGDHDIMVPSENGHDLARRIPNADLELYPDAGHGDILQDHDAFLKRVAAFPRT